MICIRMGNIITYKIVNRINNHFYIGSTFRPDNRKDRHFKDLRRGDHHCIRLQRAVNKHGIDNFEFIVISETNIEQELLNEHYGQRHCYNTAKDVAANMLGYKFSKASRLKLSLIHKGRKHTEEAKEKIRQSKLGKKHSEERRKQNAECHKGQIASEETKNKIKKAMANRDPSYKQKISEGLLTHWMTVDKDKFSTKMKDMWANMDEETKRLRSEKISKAQTGKKYSEERVRKMVEARWPKA